MRKTREQWLKTFQEIAQNYLGECLSSQYVNQRTKLEFRCSLGHTFSAQPMNVLHNGSWCPHCAGNARLTITDMQEHAAKFGGMCLSAEYVNENTQLAWQCATGHKFKATSRSLRCQNVFCAECQKLTLAEFQRLAESVDYKLLSSEYVNNYTPIRLICDQGHLWSVLPKHFKEGRRCIQCRNGANTVTLS